MCLVRSGPNWEDDVQFANRHARHHRRARVSETIITKQSNSPRPVQYIEVPPRASAPIIRPATPPKHIRAPSPPPQQVIELVSVEEDRRTSPRTSRVSVSTRGKRHSKRGDDEEVYIERERERVRMSPPEKPPQDPYDTYRYVPAPGYHDGADLDRRSSQRSITYETNPRHSQRVIERERVVVEDGGRRREYYRRP